MAEETPCRPAPARRRYPHPMSRFTVHDINPGVEIRVTRRMPPLSVPLDHAVEALWTAAAARVEPGGAGRLFNGQVFSIDAISPGLITGHMTEYRRVIAQTENHALYGDLGIRSLAVCGVLRCADGILIGRRPPAAVYQPGLWQLCPAGSVDASAVQPDGRIDARGQLLTEIREELGLSPETIGAITPLCIVEHPGSHVCDFGLMANVARDASAVMAAHRENGNGEYDPLRIVPVEDLPPFIIKNIETLVPPAPIFLVRAGMMAGQG